MYGILFNLLTIGILFILLIDVILILSGMVVINAQWRGKAFLGTLLDASENTLGSSW